MASTTGTAVQPLRLVWPPWRPPPGDGVVAVVVEAELGSGWADALLARVGHWLYVWAAADGGLAARAVEIVGYAEVVAATVAPARADPRHLGLALETACRLASTRSTGGAGSTGVCLTSWSPPDPPAGCVRVPHLLTVWHGGLATDAVVWEILQPAAAERWLGVRLHPATVEFVETNLDALVGLRAAARRGDLPPTAAVARLFSLLGPDRDLPISLVYQRPDLFRALLLPVSPEPYE